MLPSNSYSVDLGRLATWLVPKALRKDRFLVMVKAGVLALYVTYNAFLRYRDAKSYQLRITPQKCYLERLLNDRFDSTDRRIRIVDAVWHLPSFIFQEPELKPEYEYQEGEAAPRYLYQEGEVGIARLDFVVRVPMAVAFVDAEMRAMLDQYKLFGTKYTIQTF
jgi:hypothetical protein